MQATKVWVRKQTSLWENSKQAFLVAVELASYMKCRGAIECQLLA
jgi:hypothetical protein